MTPDSPLRVAWADARMSGDLKLASELLAHEERLAAADASHIDHKVKTSATSGAGCSGDNGAYSPDARNVVEFINYGQDIKVSTGVKGSTIPNHGGGGKRGAITELSRQSLSRMKLHFRNVPTDSNESYTHFLTLTYPATFPEDGKKVKYHLQRIRQWLQKRGATSGAWFLEFQARGAAHIHAAVKGSPFITSRLIAAAWCRIIGEPLQSKCFRVHAGTAGGNNRPCWEWIKKPHAISYYATKYACKPEQKQVPENYQNVGRFWGVWGKLRPVVKMFHGHGYESVNRARDVLRAFHLWRVRELGYAITDDDFRLRSAGMMWGGAEHLDDLLSQTGWTPF